MLHDNTITRKEHKMISLIIDICAADCKLAFNAIFSCLTACVG